MKDRLEQTLKKFSSRCDYLEVHIEETEESRVQFTGPQLTDLGRKVDFGGNVRALNKGGWGFASFNSVDRIDEFAQHAIDQATLVGKDKSQLADVEPVRADVKLDLKSDPRDGPAREEGRDLPRLQRTGARGSRPHRQLDGPLLRPLSQAVVREQRGQSHLPGAHRPRGRHRRDGRPRRRFSVALGVVRFDGRLRRRARARGRDQEELRDRGRQAGRAEGQGRRVHGHARPEPRRRRSSTRRSDTCRRATTSTRTRTSRR